MKSNKLTAYEAKKRKTEVKINQLLKDPIVEYVEFIKTTVCKFFGLEEIELSESRCHYSFFPRLYAIALINNHTYLKSDVMFFFGKDRTTWYNSCEEFENLISEISNKNSFEKLKQLTKETEFDKYKMMRMISNSRELAHTWEIFKQIENQL